MELLTTAMRCVLFILCAIAPLFAFASAAEVSPELRVLSDADVNRYEKIFTLQEDGRWTAADREIKALDNDVLMGYVLFQRYMHPTAYRSKFSELKRWMAYYADHPEAKKIYRLAVKRRPRNAANPVRPVSRSWRANPRKTLHPDLVADNKKKGAARMRRLEGRIRHLANRERALDAMKEIDGLLRSRRITERQYDRMRSWIAGSLYFQGYVKRAKSIANAATRNGDSGVMAYWISGLIAYREGDIADAFSYFDRMAAIPYQEDSLRAAAGFWAARTALAAGAPEAITKNLEIAAAYPFEFYGQLGLAMLGRDYDYQWNAPVLSGDQLASLKKTSPRITRATALAQIGQRKEAETELRWANGEVEAENDGALLAVATGLNLPGAQLDIALAGAGRHLEAGLFPIPDYAPADGFKVDRALLYALMRQESKFQTDATSKVGARGLMQLMPRTASYIAKDRSLRYRKAQNRLYDPGYNLQLGQSYVGYLINGAADGDLFNLAVSYNGGPGNMRRWKKEVALDDPLLFIESIPSRENRNFVEHVLTNFWVYRARLGQDAPSRDKVAAGDIPLYEALDEIVGN